MIAWLYRFPINVTLSLLLFLLTLLLAALYLGSLLHSQEETIRTSSQRELTHEISRMQRGVQYLLDRRDLTQIQEEIAALGPDFRVRLALVTDAAGDIVASLQRTDRGRALHARLKEPDLAALHGATITLLQSGRLSRAAISHYLPEQRILLAVAPLEMPAEAVRLGPPQLGSVVLGWDLNHSFNQARQDAVQTGLKILPLVLLAFLTLWWIIYQLLGRRLRVLTGTAERIAAGDSGVRADITGADDICRLAGAFNRMTDALVAEHTRLETSERQLHREKELAQVTLASIGDGVITTGTDGRVMFLNPVAEYLTGWQNAQAVGKPLGEVFHIVNELTRRPAMDPVERCLREGHIVGLANHTVLLRTDGREFAIEDSAAPIHDLDGALVGVVLVFHDVTKAREMANRLSWQASHDALTGLHNRMAFEERLRQLVRYPEDPRGQDLHTLLYIDLDQFKVVNDIAGHVAGDEMLKQVAGLMQQQVRDTDLLARLGGDEFGVILTHCDLAHAQRVADAIHRTLDDFKFSWDERMFRAGASIGVLEFRPGENSLTELLSAADMACYAAKNAGRRRTHVYQVDDVHMQRHRSEMDWAARINDAVEEDRLVLYGQTIARLGNGQMPPGLAFEVLVRMRDDDGELIAPGVFLPAAERFDLISIVDRWIITRAFSMAADCVARTGHEGIAHCAINLSGGTLGDETLLPFIKSQLSLHNLPGRLFCFEITETAAISSFQAALRFIRDLRAMGCRFALDDFGSGLSSFAYLKNLPVDYLKIDGTFVRGIATDPVNRTLVGNINDIGHLLGKQTIAEYAEDAATLTVLDELGVDYAQGYGISRPIPLEELLAGCAG